MERSFLFVFLCAAAEGDVGKHVYSPEDMSWPKAQDYCRQHHTDLSFFYSHTEIDELRSAADGNVPEGWIGLRRDPDDRDVWKWSGGEDVTFQNWRHGEPSNGSDENRGFMNSDGKWQDRSETRSFHFYCMDVTVVEQRKSWEDALVHCRRNQTHLPSLLSETDRLLAQTEIRKRNVSEGLWIGLRFLGDRWMWVNGDPLDHQAWSTRGGQDHRRPIRRRCGALSRDGLWENRDCTEKLSFICF